TGILYFPKIGNSVEVQKNKIQLYSNQVYVTDNVSDIVPEFLTLLHGVIDSPDIPLNVSRSYLQSDKNVKKITGYITKKVADKLNDLFKKDRASFEEKWNDLNVFIKYGSISNQDFDKKAANFTLIKNIDNTYFTVGEYKEKIKENQTDKYDKVVMLYTHNVEEHDGFIQTAKNRGYDVLAFDSVIDNHFLQHLESREGDITFVRVDSDTVDNLVQRDETNESVLSEDEENKIKELFEGIVAKSGTVVTKAMSPEDDPVVVVRPEFMRRMKEMQALQGFQGMDFPDSFNVVVNTNNSLIVNNLVSESDTDQQKDMAKYLYNLALLNQNMLKGAELTSFIQKSMSFFK
ncbi:MAG: molecular chaperone HtpG, partial [Bacteroidota bacterium]